MIRVSPKFNEHALSILQRINWGKAQRHTEIRTLGEDRGRDWNNAIYNQRTQELSQPQESRKKLKKDPLLESWDICFHFILVFIFMCFMFVILLDIMHNGVILFWSQRLTGVILEIF